MPDPSKLDPAAREALVEEIVRRVSARLATHPASTGPAPTGASSPAPTPAAAKALVDGGVSRIGTNGENAAACSTLAGMIDHTILKPDTRPEDIERVCREAVEHHFASVCVNSTYVPLVAQLLRGSGVKVCSVVGFPLGASSTEAKAFETQRAVADGADEIDMVINVGLLRAGDHTAVLRDIEAVVAAAQGRTVKVILETCELTDEEKIAGCVLAKAAGAHFVKTSTGFAKGGATPEDIALMRRVVGPKMGVKASGGVRDCVTAQDMIAHGATRIGASASVAILQGGAGKGY